MTPGPRRREFLAGRQRNADEEMSYRAQEAHADLSHN